MDTIEKMMNFVNSTNEWVHESFEPLNLVNLDNLAARVGEAVEMDSVSMLQDMLKELKLHGENAKEKTARKKKTAQKENNDLDTIGNKSKEDADITDPGRPRRKAFTDATERVNVQVTAPLNKKLRQSKTVKIKTERISQAEASSADDEVVQPPEIEEMPPPTALPKRAGRKKKGESIVKVERTSTRSTRTKSKDVPQAQEQQLSDVEESNEKEMEDVLLIEMPVDTIHLDVEVDEEEAKKDAVKRTRSPSTEPKKVSLPKRTKRKNSTPKMDTEHAASTGSVYENVAASVEQPMVMLSRLSKEQMEAVCGSSNTTVVISKTTVMNETIVIQKRSAANTTVVLEKPTVMPAKAVEDIMTDDESEQEVTPPVLKKVGAQLFSPFEPSPVKKKVEAFEKLGAAASTSRVTRTKTRAKAKAADSDSQSSVSPKKKLAYTTPPAPMRQLPSVSTTRSQSQSQTQLSESTKKTFSALKIASREQFRDFVELRKEKEAEALRKRELAVAKQMEEKRRKREEKQAKAKLQREQLEREKKRVMEVQMAREEKQALAVQEKQEKLNKQREEAEKRRLLVKQKHEELRREEERKRNEAAAAQRKLEEDERRRVEEERLLQAQKMRMMQKEVENVAKECMAMPRVQQPIYMTQTAPMLPTPDCYDSDDPNAPKAKAVLPAWNSKESLHQRNRAMSYIDEKVRNTVFHVKPQTLNLTELFPNLDPKKLRRNSSAVWSHAPRFTMAELHEDEDVHF